MKPNEGKITSEDVFPNHLSLSCMGYVVDCGSFTLSMKELQSIALDCMIIMRQMEGKDHE